MHEMNHSRLPFLLTFGALLLLSSCQGGGKSNQVSLSYGMLYGESSDPNSHFAQSMRMKDGKLQPSVFTPISTVQSLVEKKESFLLLNVPSFSCLCYSEFRDTCLLPYMREHNLKIYLLRQSELEELEAGKRFGIEIASDPAICLFSKGEIIAQKEAKTGDAFHDSYKSFASWMDGKISSFPQFLSVNDAQLDALYGGNKDFLIYYARSSCTDCGYLESDFLSDYLEKRESKLSDCYYIDCDFEGIRYQDGEFDQDLWNAYKLSHGLAYSEQNPIGYDGGYVPTLMRISPKQGKKTGDVIAAMNVYFNDTYEKQENGDYLITSSFFSEERLAMDALSYLAESNVETKVLKGLNLGSYAESDKAPYSWYQKKMAPYHNAIIKAFLDS